MGRGGFEAVANVFRGEKGEEDKGIAGAAHSRPREGRKGKKKPRFAVKEKGKGGRGERKEESGIMP